MISPGRGLMPTNPVRNIGQSFLTGSGWLLGGIVILGLFMASFPDLPDRADLVIGNGTDPGSLHPHRASGIPEGRIIRALHEGLLLLDPQSLEPMPACAHSWQVSKDAYLAVCLKFTQVSLGQCVRPRVPSVSM